MYALKKYLVIFMIFIMINIVVADTWEYTLFIYDIMLNNDASDDVQLSNHTIVVDEGTTGTFFGGSNSAIENISINRTYFVFIKGNTTEGDYNYDDTPTGGQTFWTSNKFSGDTTRGWIRGNITGQNRDNEEYTINLTIVPFDKLGPQPNQAESVDILFWSTVFDDSITENVADKIDYTVNVSVFKEVIKVEYIKDFIKKLKEIHIEMDGEFIDRDGFIEDIDKLAGEKLR
ncbi:hypothetical protein LCGC14_2596680 [marine sediment metagenome]|uniref:Uncharacterized protein n=1 Tax=marine sediment metagenome TaxID=412755 RepID=A0A0F9AXW3_9ZZZZ